MADRITIYNIESMKFKDGILTIKTIEKGIKFIKLTISNVKLKLNEEKTYAEVVLQNHRDILTGVKFYFNIEGDVKFWEMKLRKVW